MKDYVMRITRNGEEIAWYTHNWGWRTNFQTDVFMLSHGFFGKPSHGDINYARRLGQVFCEKFPEYGEFVLEE